MPSRRNGRGSAGSGGQSRTEAGRKRRRSDAPPAAATMESLEGRLLLSSVHLATGFDTGYSDQDNITNLATVSLRIDVEMGDVTIRNNEAVVGTTVFMAAGSYIIPNIPLSAGLNSFVVQVSSTGHLISESSELPVLLDQAAPAKPGAPDLLPTSDSGASDSDNVTNINPPAFAGSGAEPNAMIRLFANSLLVGRGVVAYDGRWQITSAPLSNGTHAVTIELEDAAGNVSPLSAALNVTVDTKPPQAPTIDLAAASDTGFSDSDNVTRLSTVNLVVTGEAGTAVTIRDNGAVLTTIASAAASQTVAVDLGSAGLHTLTVESTDLAGNFTSQPLALAVTVDQTAPLKPAAPDMLAASDSGVSSSDNITNVSAPAFGGAGVEPNAMVWLYADGALIGRGVVTPGGAWEITSQPLADGPHAVTAQLEDAAGNLSTLSDPLTVLIDTLPPLVPAIDLTAGSDTGLSNTDNVTNLSTVDLYVTAEAGTSVTIENGGSVLTTIASALAAQTVTVDLGGEGTHTLTVESYDAAGNVTKQPLALVITVDQTDPAKPAAPDLLATADSGVSNTDNITNINAPAFAGTGEAGTMVRLLADGLLVGQGAVTTGGAWQITAQPLTDGAHAMTVELEDLAGNVSAVSDSLTVTIDTLAPQRPTLDLQAADDTGYSNIDNITTATTVRLDVTAEPGATVVLRDGEAGTAGQTFTMGAGGMTTRTVAFAPGVHLLSMDVTDTAGNRSQQSVELALTVDVTAPATPGAPDMEAGSDSGTSSTDNLTNINAPAFAGTAEANALVRLYADGLLVGQGFVTSGGSWEITSQPLTDGAHNMTVLLEDAAGNVSGLSDALTIAVDTAAPPRPTMDLQAADDTGLSDHDNITNRTTLRLHVSAEAGARVVILDGENPVADPAGQFVMPVTADGFVTVTVTLTEGVHALSVLATDASGNRGQQSEQLLLTVDATAPDATGVTFVMLDASKSLPAPGSATSVQRPAFQGLAEANALIRVFGNGELVGQGVVNSDQSDGVDGDGLGTWEITVEPLADGDYTMTLEIEDAAGNITATGSLAVTVDTQTPQRPTLDLLDADDTGPSSLDNVTHLTTLRFRVSGEAGATVKIKDGEVVIDSFTMPVTADGFTVRTLSLAAGPHPMSAEVFDAAGNRSQQAEQLVVAVDPTAPAGPTLELLAASDTLPLGDGVTSITDPAFKGTAEGGALVRLYANGELVGQTVASPAGAWTITTETLMDNNYVFTATAEDQAGNVSPASATVSLAVAINYGFTVDPITGAVEFLGEDGIADVVSLSLNAAGTNLMVNWSQPSLGRSGLGIFALAVTPTIRITGQGGDDTLIVDNSNGLVDLSNGIFFDGGAGHDTLVLTGTLTVDSRTYDVGPLADSGRITDKLGAGTQVVSFAALEPVIDLVAGPVVINGTAGPNAIDLNLGPSSGSAAAGGAPTLRVAVDNFESMEFANATSVTINGLAGNDTINLNNVTLPPGLTGITVDGGSGDDTIVGSAGDDTLIGGPGNDTLLGMDGNDTLVGGPGTNTTDGGNGSNTVTLALTDAPDTVHVTAAGVTVNGVFTGTAHVANLTVDTAGGNDSVVIDVDQGFPATMDLTTGVGSDTVLVNLINPAAGAVLNLDAGPSGSGDAVTLRGATGDDQFSTLGGQWSFGGTTVVLAGFDTTSVLEGRRIDSDRATLESSKFSFFDADGNVATVSMSGPGHVDVYRDVAGGSLADIQSLVLAGTNPASTRLGVSVAAARGADNRTSIGSLEGGGAFSISAPHSDLVGTGIDLPDGLQSLTLGDIADGANIDVGGKSGQVLSLVAGNVDFVNLLTTRFLNMRVKGWAGGVVQASLLGTITVTANGLGADLINTRQSRIGLGLLKLSVHGDLTATISADRIYSISVVGGDVNLAAVLTSDALDLPGRQAFGTLSIVGGDLLGANISMQPGTTLGSLSVHRSGGVGGSVTGEVFITGNLASTSVSLDVSGTQWHVGGAMGAAAIGGSLSADVLVDGANAKGVSLASLTVGATIDAQVTVLDALGSVRAARWAGGKLTADSLASINITGKSGKTPIVGDFLADVVLAGANVAAGKKVLGTVQIAHDLVGSAWQVGGQAGTLTVGHLAQGSSLRAAGSIARIDLHATEGSDFLAGVPVDSLLRRANVATDFADTTAKIGSIVIRGWSLRAGDPTRFVVDSNFTGAFLGPVSLANIDAGGTNGLVVLGDMTHLKSLAVRDTMIRANNFAWPPIKPMPATANLTVSAIPV